MEYSKHSELKSFACAFSGLFELARTQKHFRFHIIAASCVTLAGLVFGISRMEWMLIVFAISSVMAAEALNTAIEFTLDAVHPETHPLVKTAKDTAAGAVLVCSIASAVVGLLIFTPRIF